MLADLVDGVKMVIVPVRLHGLRVNILPQRRLQKGGLKIMRGQRVPRKQRMDISVRDQLGERLSRIMVKRESRPGNPNDFPVLAVVAQDFVQFIIIPRKSRFTRTLLAEGKEFPPVVLIGVEAVCMDEDPLAAVLRPAEDYGFPFLQKAEFLHQDAAVFINRYTVHAAFFCKQPLAS